MSTPPRAESHTGVAVQHLSGGRIAHVTLDLGKGNIIDGACIASLREVFQGLSMEKPLCAVILDAAGKDFSFGASVEEHAPGQVDQMLPALHNLAREVLDLNTFLVAAIQGRCLGGGLELALLADRIVATPSACLGQPEVSLGVFAPLASALLPHRVGPPLATDLLTSGRTLSGEQALTQGLVQELADDPTQAAIAWCEEHLAPKSAEGLRHAVSAARHSWRAQALSTLAELEEVYLGPLQQTADALEGITAFLERRKPTWRDA
ncbi:MAG TPA: enoyl-CoA hydratase/isomerase family protein [Planctomycetota bacterium]|nr:enoyl-CoA hydratase/isomerase family protein [Planctomycetota bacterium]